MFLVGGHSHMAEMRKHKHFKVSCIEKQCLYNTCQTHVGHTRAAPDLDEPQYCLWEACQLLREYLKVAW